ncbi:MAG: hypothetical protein ACI9NN_001302, partial [Bacteroidia bacterium]
MQKHFKSHFVIYVLNLAKLWVTNFKLTLRSRASAMSCINYKYETIPLI